jgi:hypothetical protein
MTIFYDKPSPVTSFNWRGFVSATWGRREGRFDLKKLPVRVNMTNALSNNKDTAVWLIHDLSHRPQMLMN